MSSFDISQSISTIKPQKEYRGLRLPRDQFICRKISYCNNSNEPKRISIESDSEHLIVKNPTVQIMPRTSEYIHLRMYFPKGTPETVVPRVRVFSETGLQEQLVFYIRLLQS